MQTQRVLVAEKLSERGLEVLRAAAPEVTVDVKIGMKPEELLAEIGSYEALAVRSATKVTKEVIEAGRRLKVIGRAGIGVDNIDVPAASKRGIVVMNTPEGNVVTTAEHAISLMASLARKIPQATASMKQGKWEKSKFQGRELFNKTLGVIGLGNIGKVVADRALGLKMKVVAYDPYISKERGRELGVEMLSIDDLLARSDFITLHVPMAEATKGIISRAAIEKMKKGAFLINAARGGLCDEAAVAEAVRSGRLGGAAFDVFEKEPPVADNPLLGVENIILTPHLGASTDEAQENVALEVAQQVVDFLKNGVVKNAVNAPNVSAELIGSIGPYVRLGRKVGALSAQLHQGGVQKVKMVYQGATAGMSVAPISVSMLTGLLASRLGEDVNEVNAPVVAKERGIKSSEEKSPEPIDFAATVSLIVEGDEGTTEVTGALVAGEPRVVRVNGMRLEIVPEGHLILTRHRDRPGIIGALGSILGAQNVNISRLTLGLDPSAGGLARAAFGIDGPVSDEVLQAIAGVAGIHEAKLVQFR